MSKDENRSLCEWTWPRCFGQLTRVPNASGNGNTYASRARNLRLEITFMSRLTENNSSVDKFFQISLHISYNWNINNFINSSSSSSSKIITYNIYNNVKYITFLKYVFLKKKIDGINNFDLVINLIRCMVKL